MRFFTLIAWALMCASTVLAQSETATKPPFYQLLDHLKVSTEAAKSVAPNLPAPSADFQNQLNSWIEKYPTQWQALLQLPAVSAQEINWASYGVVDKNLPKREEVLADSHWQWFISSKISTEKRERLFPHFPLATGLKNTDQNIKTYNAKVGIWMRLYPKEYQAFLNAPEIAALVPDRKGDIKLNYMPKFIGAPITSKKPIKKNTDNELLDEYNYQLALRYWAFLYNEAEYNRLYAKDYDFPSDFDAVRFKVNARAKIYENERGSMGEDDYKKLGSTEPAKGTMNWTNKNKQ